MTKKKDKQCNRILTCSICGNSEPALLTEEEMEAQLQDEFFGSNKKDCNIVCDDCFQKHFTKGE